MAKDKTSQVPGAWAGKLSKFGKFLKLHKITRDAVAEGVGITRSYVSMIGHGKASPSFALAKRISEWTKANAPTPFELSEW